MTFRADHCQLPRLYICHNLAMDSDKSSLTPVTPDYNSEGPCFANPLMEPSRPDRMAPSEPTINKESLMKKLESIPTETLRSILTNQVDLEICLKHKELQLTEEEIGKCEAQMLALRKFFEVPNDITFRNEPSDFTLKYYDVLNKSLSVNFTSLQQQRYALEHPPAGNYVTDPEPVHSYRTRSTTSSLRPSVAGAAVRVAGCLYRRTDGIIVKLTCPDCHRSNFSSAQGFLNHSRIAHSKEYTSQDAAALSCGEILGDEYQDEEGAASLAVLRLKSMDASKNLNVNEIYFNGLSKSLNTVHRALQELAAGAVGAPGKSETASLSPGAEPKGDDNELMKKLIKSGVAHDESEYNAMVAEVRSAVPNSHLFDDEEEIPTEEVPEPRAVEPTVGHSRKGASSRQGGAVRPQLSGAPQPQPDAQPAQTQPNAQDERHQGEGEGEAAGTAHAETGGKYDNRLRRRKSRGAEDAAREDDGRRKRRKSQR